MSDVFTKSKRSEVMSRIRSRGNQATEVVVARLLRAAGITGWRRQVAIRFQGSASKRQAQAAAGRGRVRALKPETLNSKPTKSVRPDFVFPRARVAVFVDGCFWHGCPKHATWPKQNAAFWAAKIARNQARDRQVTRKLRAQGWTVLRIWEHALKKPERVVARVRRWVGVA